LKVRQTSQFVVYGQSRKRSLSDIQIKTPLISIHFCIDVFNNGLMKTRIPRTVGFCIGILLVTNATYLWYRNSKSDEQRLQESAERSRYVFDQYLNADYDSAKRSILDHISWLDKLSAASPNPERNPFSADAVSWFVRLAKLEERSGGDARGDYMGQARLRCEKQGKADCSVEMLSQDTGRLDDLARSQLPDTSH
jgi:hypothetical protein